MDINQITAIASLTVAKVEILKLRVDEYNWQCHTSEEQKWQLLATLDDINLMLEELKPAKQSEPIGLGDLERLIGLSAALNLAVKDAAHVELATGHWNSLPVHLQDAIEATEQSIENDINQEQAGQFIDKYCSSKKVHPNCEYCHGTGRYDGRKCDGMPF